MNPRLKNRGFTLAELLIVLAVMTTITSMVLANYKDYGVNARFANAAENIVLSLRQAQIYGVGVKANSAACGGLTAFDCAYGVYFSRATPGQLILFVDTNNNNRYDAGEALQTVTWLSPIAINNVGCNGAADCGGSNIVSVTFRRPNPSAVITDSVGVSTYNSAEISITNGTKTSIISVKRTGQISLK